MPLSGMAKFTAIISYLLFSYDIVKFVMRESQ